jgi:hypothetical protein
VASTARGGRQTASLPNSMFPHDVVENLIAQLPGNFQVATVLRQPKNKASQQSMVFLRFGVAMGACSGPAAPRGTRAAGLLHPRSRQSSHNVADGAL